MTQYNYDSSGAFFNFFILSFLALFLVPYTYKSLSLKSRVFSGPTLSIDEDRKYARLRDKERKHKSLWKYVILAGAWVVFAYVVVSVARTKIEEALWDPYEILSVSSVCPFSSLLIY